MPDDAPTLRPMVPDDWHEVADLICASMNHWYRAHAMPPTFPGGPAVPQAIIEAYESLDPGCCVLAQHPRTRRIMGSCFYHPRETHVSLGMMAVHPNYFAAGVGRRLVKFITDIADRADLPTRLISSALNLDSYSLYNRCGFVPRCLYQDVVLTVPDAGLGPLPDHLRAAGTVRDATLDDVEAMAEVEIAVSGIRRAKDYRHFIDNAAGMWHTSVLESDRGDGSLAGFLVSLAAGDSCSIGPGVARDERSAATLLHRALDHRRGRHPLVLCPAEYPALVHLLYAWGGRNVELHVAQVRGEAKPFDGVTLPTFMPETG